MKTTKFQYGHRWTMVELSTLMELWQDNEPLREIAIKFHSTPNAILKVVQRLRANGVPLTRRTKGHISGRSQKLWTQSEVEYLIRRRAEKATNEEIAAELGRSEIAVYGMVYNLRRQHVPIAMRGNGVRKLYNLESLKALAIQMPDFKEIMLEN